MTVNTVLIVDDSETERTNLEQIARSVGCRVITASNGIEAIALAEQRQPDLILLDIVMDDMDGYQTCRKLSRGAQTKEIPVVIVSGKKQKPDKMWAMEQGARDYVTKPYSAEQIIEHLNRY